MTVESDIVKMLKEAEKLGQLHSQSQENYEELQMPKESLDVAPDRTAFMGKDDLKSTRKNGELGSITEKYQTIFENYTVAITLVDNKERIVSWNKYAEELFNMTEKDMFMAPVSSLYPQEEWQKIRAENIRQKGIKYRIESRMIRKNQGTFDVELSLCTLKGAEGKTVGSVGIIKDISKLKETEKKLIGSENRYRTIFENSAVGIMLTDENEQIISWNKFTENILGMGKEDLYLKPVELLYPAEAWQKIRSENIRQKGMQHHLETKMFKKNNGTIDVDLSVSVLKNHEGRITGSIGVIADITESKQMKCALEESEEKFKQLYEKAPISYHTLSPNGKITDVNERWCQILGYSKRGVIGRPIFDFISENEREAAKSSFEKKILSKKSYTGGHERTYVTKDGEKRMLVVHDFFSFDKDKNVRSIHTTMEDITKRKQVEGELRESEEKYRCIVENSSDLIMLTQPDGIISYLSPACEKVLGYNAEELIGQQPWIIYPDDLEKAKEVHYRALKGERGTDFEYRIKTKTGKIKWISHSWSPVFKDDKVQMMTSVVRDITERKKADEKLKEKIDELERYKNVTVGRELRMVELKKRIKKLEEK